MTPAGILKVLLQDGQIYYLLAFPVLYVRSQVVLHTGPSFPWIALSAIMLFSPSNPIIFRTVSSLRDSERHTDECHGLSSVQEYDAIGKWGRESGRDFYYPVHLKKNLFGKESQPWVVSGETGDAAFHCWEQSQDTWIPTMPLLESE